VTTQWGLIVAAVVAAYILGSLPIGLWVGLLRGLDIRRVGSGNVGATNVYRALGTGAALVVFAGDALKGWLPVRMGMAWQAPDALVLGLGLAAIAGHSFSVFLRFKGGRAVATALGVLLALSWQTALGALGVWIVVMATLRIVSLGSILAAASVPLFMWRFHGLGPFFYFASTIAALVILRHAPNIRRLARGEEKPISRLADGPPQEPQEP
jgi:glycerol-3-phosphate acyltransferase PlsY